MHPPLVRIRRASAALLLGSGLAMAARADVPEVDARAARVHGEALVVDGHNDATTWMLDYGFDLGMDGADPEKTDATW